MRKFLIILLVLAALMSVAFASPESDFLDRMGPVAQEIVPKYGLFPSVFLAQAALESGWGRSYLAQNANNYFGRKCLEEPCIEVWTPEYVNGVKQIELKKFQFYFTITSATHGYCQQFYRRWKSGTLVYTINTSNAEAFVHSIAPIYATDPEYAEKVLKVIEQYDLKRYDR